MDYYAEHFCSFQFHLLIIILDLTGQTYKKCVRISLNSKNYYTSNDFSHTGILVDLVLIKYFAIKSHQIQKLKISQLLQKSTDKNILVDMHICIVCYYYLKSFMKFCCAVTEEL